MNISYYYPFASKLNLFTKPCDGRGTLNFLIDVATRLKEDYDYDIEYWYVDENYVIWFTVPHDYSEIKIGNLLEVLDYYSSVGVQVAISRK